MAYRSQFGDTTFTKVFVGGLAWETETEEMQRYFEQFGDILEAVIITDKHTGKSKGYGFVTFRDADTARRACVDPNPVIDGRRANCNIASLGRQRHSPPRGRNFGGYDNFFQRRTPPQGTSSTRAPPQLNPTPPHPPPVMYSSYGYPAYTSDYWYQQQCAYNNQQYYHQLNATPSGGYSFQSPSGMYGTPQAHSMGASSYLYYPTNLGSFPSYPSPSSFPHQPNLRQSFPSTTDGQENSRRGELGPESDISSSETNLNA